MFETTFTQTDTAAVEAYTEKKKERQMDFSRIQRLKRRFLSLGIFGFVVTLVAAAAVLFNPDVAWHGRVKHCRLAVSELAKSLNSASNMPVLVRRDNHLGSTCPEQIALNLPGNTKVPISVISVAHPVVTELRYSDAGLVCTYHWDSIHDLGNKTAKELKAEEYELVLGSLGKQKYQRMPTFGPGVFDLSHLNLAGYQKFARVIPNVKEFFRNVPRVYYYNRGSAYDPPGLERFEGALREDIQTAQMFTIAGFGSMAVLGLPLISLGLMGIGRLYSEYGRLSPDGWIIPLWPFVKSSDLALDDEVWRQAHASRLRAYHKSRRKTQEEQRQLERANDRLLSLQAQPAVGSEMRSLCLSAMNGQALPVKLAVIKRVEESLAVAKQPVCDIVPGGSRTDRVKKLIATLERITNPKYRHEISEACTRALELAEEDYRRAKNILAAAHRVQSARNREDKYDPRLVG